MPEPPVTSIRRPRKELVGTDSSALSITAIGYDTFLAATRGSAVAILRPACGVVSARCRRVVAARCGSIPSGTARFAAPFGDKDPLTL